MAQSKRPRDYFYTPHDSGRMFDPEYFYEVGDTVVRTSKASSRYSTVQKGTTLKVIKVDDLNGSNTGEYIYSNGVYYYVYHQKIQVEGSTQWYNANNFMITRKGTGVATLALDVDRPTFVREFKEVVVDGKTTREYVGDWISFDNMSAAKVHTQNEITASIRAKNDYRKFAIFQEKHVSQAKQPEIEFV